MHQAGCMSAPVVACLCASNGSAHLRSDQTCATHTDTLLSVYACMLPFSLFRPSLLVVHCCRHLMTILDPRMMSARSAHRSLSSCGEAKMTTHYQR